MSLVVSALTLSFLFIYSILDGDLENHDVSQLSQETLDTIEADSFWCMSKLLDGIQVNVYCSKVHDVQVSYTGQYSYVARRCLSLKTTRKSWKSIHFSSKDFGKWKRHSHNRVPFQSRAILSAYTLFAILDLDPPLTGYSNPKSLMVPWQLVRKITCKCIKHLLLFPRIITHLHSLEFKWKSMHSENLFRESMVSEN